MVLKYTKLKKFAAEEFNLNEMCIRDQRFFSKRQGEDKGAPSTKTLA